MSSRLNEANATKHFKNVQASAKSKETTNKFTQKQSKFALRNEEKQLSAAAASGGTSFGSAGFPPSGGPSAAPMRGGRRGAPNASFPPTTSDRRGSARAYQPSNATPEAPEPYIPLSNPPPARRSQPVNMAWNPFSPTMPEAPKAALPQRVIPQVAISAPQRRSDRFALHDNSHGDNNNSSSSGGAYKRMRSEDDHSGGGSFGGLLGAARQPAVAEFNDPYITHNPNDDDGGAQGPGAGATGKWDRFQQIIDDTRRDRAQQHRDRLAKDQQTTFLDSEFDDIMGLLQKRDRIAEDKQQFADATRPEVMAVIQQYRPQGRVAKILTIGSSSATEAEAAAVAAAAAAPPVVVVDTTATITNLRDPKASKKSLALDAGSKALLAEINAKARDTRAPKAIEKMPVAAVAIHAPVSASASGAAAVAGSKALSFVGSGAIGFGDEATGGLDAFDMLMGQMKMETKRARVTDRTLTEQEVEIAEKQQALVAADRAEAPEVDHNMTDFTRKEWIARGGDRAHQMDAGEEEGDDNAEEGEEGEDEDLDYDGVESGDDLEGEDDADFGAEGQADEEGGAAAGSAKQQQHPVDKVIATIESAVSEHVRRVGRLTTTFDRVEEARRFRQQVSDLTVMLYNECKKSAYYGADSLRLLLVNMQQEVSVAFASANDRTLAAALTPFHLTMMLVMQNLFPASDYRHDVVTPLLIFACSVLMQAKVRSLDDVRVLLCVASLLADGMQRAGRFASEPLVAALNVLALLMPREDIEPRALCGVRLPCPMLSRPVEPLLALCGDHSAESVDAPLPPLVSLTASFEDQNDSNNNSEAPTAAKRGARVETAAGGPLAANKSAQVAGSSSGSSAADRLEAARLSIIHTTLRLITSIIESTGSIAGAGATAAVIEPLRATYRLVQQSVVGAKSLARLPSGLADLLEDVLAKAAAAEKHVKDTRTPLAMRTFRPRPLRQFEPLLMEAENADVTEHKHLKRVLREDRKRVVRHVQAQASSDRKLREREAAVVDAHRTDRYHELMSELQQQQHIMKTVDGFMDKARSKKKKSISGMSTVPSNAEGGGEE